VTISEERNDNKRQEGWFYMPSFFFFGKLHNGFPSFQIYRAKNEKYFLECEKLHNPNWYEKHLQNKTLLHVIVKNHDAKFGKHYGLACDKVSSVKSI
jgi:hypothetical protein